MINSPILIFILILLSLSTNLCFYFKNADILEHCNDDKIRTFAMNAFKYMSCYRKEWRRSTLSLKYSCVDGRLKREWYFKTDSADNPSKAWPTDINLITGNDLANVANAAATGELVITDVSKSSNLKENQFVTYLWASLSQGPQCRLKYTIRPDKCSKVQSATFNEFTCYHGTRVYSFFQPSQRKDFDAFIDNYKKTSPPKQMTTIDSKTHSNQSSNDHNLLPMTDTKAKKKKKILIIGGIILVVIVVIIILVFVFNRNSSN